MKIKLLFTLLITFFNLQLFSQEYEPIIKEGSFWDIKTTTTTTDCSIVYLKRIQINGDTIINNKTYTKLKSVQLKNRNNDTYCISAPFYYDSNDFTSIENTFLREDINEKKLYILTNTISNNQLEEYTVCDFSLNTGDTIDNYFGFNNSEHLLKIIDIKLNSDNKKVFYVNDGSFYTEGIGRNEGNLNIYFNLIDGTYERNHCNGSAQNSNNCATHILSTNKNELSSLNIFPNPAKDMVTIQNKENTTIKIFSLTGSLLKKKTSKTNVEINISTFKSGIYILEVSNSKGKISSKIIKL